MAITRKRLGENLARIGENIAAAAGRAGRNPAEVQLVAVTKAAEVEDVKTLIELGVGDLGENRVQQLVARAGEIDQWLARRRRETPERPRWHLIGHLQRNKVKGVLEWSSVIHSVDSLRLAEEIENRAARAERVVDVLLQVNCSEEAQKSGVAVGAASHLAELLCTLAHLRLCGLMTMAPISTNPEKARPTFVRLREIFEEMRAEKIGGAEMRHLSMGMTQDYEVAVEEGASIVRIGSAVFQ